MIFIVAIIVLSLFLSAFFSSSETALTGSNSYKLKEQAKDNKKLFHTIWLLENKEKSIGVILLGNTLSNVVLASFSGSLGYIVAGDTGVVYSTLLVAGIVFMFGELIPKFYSIRHADSVLISVSRILHFLIIILNPLVFILQKIAQWILKPFQNSSSYQPNLQLDTIYGVINSYASNKNRHELGNMMSAIVMLEDTTVKEIMTHRSDVFIVSNELDPDKVLQRIFKSPYSRIPVIHEQKKIIVGILHVKELALKAQNKPIESITWDDLKQCYLPLWLINENTNVITQLRLFREKRQHMAVVVDDRKIFQGIITLEDVLEEITGNIEDEADIKNQPLKISDSLFRFNANLSIKEANRRFNTRFSITKEYATIAGMILYHCQNIPKEHQIFYIEGHLLHILRATNRRILRLELQVNP